jgi:Fe-S cluster assembly protein SufD
MKEVIEKTVGKEAFLNDFRDFAAVYGLQGRKEAIEAFEKTGFPTVRSEEWKYTNISLVTSRQYMLSNPQSKSNLTASDIKEFKIAGKDALVVVFENGKFNESLSSELLLKEGVEVFTMAGNQDHRIINNYFSKIADFQHEAFVALNTAFTYDGICINIHEETTLEQPIHIMHVNDSRAESLVTYPRNLVIAGKSSKFSVVESYHSLNDRHESFSNCVTEILVKENANVDYYKVQLENDKAAQVNFSQVVQEKNSTFNIVTVTLSGKLVRNNLHIKLEGINCTSHLYGLYLADGNELIDNHTLVDHTMPNCYSNELYKGIIDGKATGVFNGKIFVRKDAQKTNAYQSNKNILLSDDAQMNTKPQLEIFADDVKCTHGATTGQLDEDALFYLRSRGIGQDNARALLNIAFSGDVLNNIRIDALKNNLMQMANQKLKQNKH